jgi:hypothetical protein
MMLSSVEIYISRFSVSLLAFGLATLSGLLPLFAKEQGRNAFIFLTCLCGIFCLILPFHPSSQSSQSTLDGFIPIGCALMAMCQVLLKNIPRVNPHQRTLNPAAMDEDCEEGEIELMIPQTPSEGTTSNAAESSAMSQRNSTLTEIEVAFLCFSNLLALTVLSFTHGVIYSSKEHVGYGKLIATILFVCLMSTTEGVLVLRTELLSDKYFQFILALSCGYPLGIIFETLFRSSDLLAMNSIFMDTALSLIPLSQGVLLYVALMALTGSDVRARGKSVAKIGGMVSGIMISTILIFVNLYL